MDWTRHSLTVCLSLFVGAVIKPAALADDERSMLDSWLIRTWQTDQGLPDNRVTGVVQAADGHIWVSTLGGLRRYDGADFEEYSIEHLPKVSNRLVRGMHLDRSDGLWLVMGRGGVIHVRGAAARVFDAEDGIENARVRFMTDDSEGNFWFVVGRLIHRIRGETVDRFGVEDGLPMASSTGTCVASDREGRLWFAREEKVGLYREGRWEVRLTLDASPARLLGASGGGLWICLPSRVCRFSEEDGLREVVQLPKTMTVQVMLEDRQGALWIGTMADGLFCLQEGRIRPVAVSQPEINSLMQDREGNLWVGTQGGGLNMLHPRAVELIDAQAGLPMESVRSVCQDTEGWLWAAFQNGALARGRGRQWRAMTSADGWPGADVTCVTAAREGGVWIGTRDRGLHRLQAGQFQQWSTAEGLASQSVRSLLEASNGDLWVATDTPKQMKVFRHGVFHKANLPGAIQVVRALVEDAHGTIWAGTSDGRLLEMVGDTAVSRPEVEAWGSPSIRCLHATPDGSVWIGYAGQGVGRWRGGQYARVGSAQGLHDDYVAQIQSDGRGGLWLNGNHGLFQVALESLLGVMEGREQHIRSIGHIFRLGKFIGRMTDAAHARHKNHPHWCDGCHLLRIMTGTTLHVFGR